MNSAISSVLATLLTVIPIAQSTPEAADALDGLDPVMLIAGKEVPGKSALSVTHGGFTYLFSTAENKATFEREPGKYEIQLGGMCARMGKTASGNPSDFIVHGGKIYVFGSDDCHKKFAAAPAKYLAPPPEPLPSSPPATAKARQLLDRAVVALGGAGPLDGLSSYAESFSQIQARPQGDATVVTKTIWRFPDRVRQERATTIQGKAMSSATIVSPQGMWFVSGQGDAYPMRPAARASLEQDFGRHPIALLRHRREQGFSAAALGPGSIDGIAVEKVRIRSGAADVTLGIGASGRIHSATFSDRNSEGEVGTVTVVYGDFRPVEGLRLPFAIRATFNGQPLPQQSMTLDAIALNVPADLSLFAPKSQAHR
jgi:YHS domain-containing protein